MDTRGLIIKLQDDDTEPTVEDGVFTFVVPELLNGKDLIGIEGGVTTASSSGDPEWDLYNETDSISMLTTTLTIDAHRIH
jgi:hypothetical protein